MTVNYTERYAVHPDDCEIYNTALLRENFHVGGLFKPGEINLVYTQIDRFIVGGACPSGEPLKLDTIDALKAKDGAAYFANYNLIEVDPSEPHAANCLPIGDSIIFPTAFPKTRTKLEERGYKVIPVEVDELAKAEGAVTCCSLILG